jgi:hypothetical protein
MHVLEDLLAATNSASERMHSATSGDSSMSTPQRTRGSSERNGSTESPVPQPRSIMGTALRLGGDRHSQSNPGAMPDLTAKRTLVKSPPELWEELSEVDRLAKHLDAFGEIKITKLEPEHTVAWEGVHASGTVSIEPSGWGTKVTLTADFPEPAPPPVEEPPVDEIPEAEPPPVEEAPVEEPPVEEPPVEEPPVEEPPVEEPPVEELAVEEPLVEEPRVEEPRAEHMPLPPITAPKPVARRRRGFWAWLFRARSERQVAPPVVAEPLRAEPKPEPVLVAAPAPAEPEPVAAEPEVPLVEPEGPVAEPEPPVVDPEPPVVDPEPVVEPPQLSEPEPDPEPAPEASEPDDNGLAPDDARAALDEMLDALGSAHHRPFSRG